jgi:hypothetical protein
MRLLSLMSIFGLLVTGRLLGRARTAGAASAEAAVNAISTSGVGARLGKVAFTDTAGGLLGQRHQKRLTAQLVEQRLGLFQIGGIEALGEPVVDFGEHGPSLLSMLVICK